MNIMFKILVGLLFLVGCLVCVLFIVLLGLMLIEVLNTSRESLGLRSNDLVLVEEVFPNPGESVHPTYRPAKKTTVRVGERLNSEGQWEGYARYHTFDKVDKKHLVKDEDE